MKACLRGQDRQNMLEHAVFGWKRTVSVPSPRHLKEAAGRLEGWGLGMINAPHPTLSPPAGRGRRFRLKTTDSRSVLGLWNAKSPLWGGLGH